MAKPAHRSYSRYTRDAATLLGVMIRNARIERNLTVAELAERAGVSRGLVQRVEQGELGSSVGAVFELAAIVGLRLFDSDSDSLSRQLSDERHKVALLPRAAHKKANAVNDDF